MRSLVRLLDRSIRRLVEYKLDENAPVLTMSSNWEVNVEGGLYVENAVYSFLYLYAGSWLHGLIGVYVLFSSGVYEENEE